jgi:hypothetical protein
MQSQKIICVPKTEQPPVSLRLLVVQTVGFKSLFITLDPGGGGGANQEQPPRDQGRLQLSAQGPNAVSKKWPPRGQFLKRGQAETTL